jgi:hypothetical protein
MQSSLPAFDRDSFSFDGVRETTRSIACGSTCSSGDIEVAHENGIRTAPAASRAVVSSKASLCAG